MKVISLFFFLLLTVFSHSQEGMPDASFGNAGYIAVPGPGIAAFKKDGSFLQVGTSGIQSLTIKQFTREGVPEMSFGTQGVVTTVLDNRYHLLPVVAVAIQEDGKILVGLHAFYPGPNPFFLLARGRYLIVRYLPDGVLDHSFGNNGIVEEPWTVPPLGVQLSKIHVQEDGKVILMLRLDGNRFAAPFIVRRLNPEGSHDLDYTNPPIPSGQSTPLFNSAANSFSFHKDGSLTAGTLGRDENSAQGSDFLWLYRFTRDGSPDHSFGTGGVVHHPDVKDIISENLAIQSDGKIVMESRNILYRFNNNGSKDRDFGYDGKVRSPFNVHKLLVQDDDKIVTAGNIIFTGSNGHFLLARYDPGGQHFDASFGYGGMTAIAVTAEAISTEKIEISNNRLYVYGGGYLAAFQSMSSQMVAGIRPPGFGGAQVEGEPAINAIVAPNPAVSHFNLNLRGSIKKTVQIIIYDAVGRTVEIKKNVTARGFIRLGDHYRPGIYYAEIIQDKKRTTIKLIKGSR